MSDTNKYNIINGLIGCGDFMVNDIVNAQLEHLNYLDAIHYIASCKYNISSIVGSEYKHVKECLAVLHRLHPVYSFVYDETCEAEDDASRIHSAIAKLVTSDAISQFYNYVMTTDFREFARTLYHTDTSKTFQLVSTTVTRVLSIFTKFDTAIQSLTKVCTRAAQHSNTTIQDIYNHYIDDRYSNDSGIRTLCSILKCPSIDKNKIYRANMFADVIYFNRYLQKWLTRVRQLAAHIDYANFRFNVVGVSLADDGSDLLLPLRASRMILNDSKVYTIHLNGNHCSCNDAIDFDYQTKEREEGKLVINYRSLFSICRSAVSKIVVDLRSSDPMQRCVYIFSEPRDGEFGEPNPIIITHGRQSIAKYAVMRQNGSESISDKLFSHGAILEGEMKARRASLNPPRSSQYVNDNRGILNGQLEGQEPDMKTELEQYECVHHFVEPQFEGYTTCITNIPDVTCALEVTSSYGYYGHSMYIHPNYVIGYSVTDEMDSEDEPKIAGLHEHIIQRLQASSESAAKEKDAK